MDLVEISEMPRAAATELTDAQRVAVSPTQCQAARAAYLLALVDKVAHNRRHAGNGSGAQRVALTTRPITIFGHVYNCPVRPDACGRLWIATAPAEEVGRALEAVASLPGRHRLATLSRLYEQTWTGAAGETACADEAEAELVAAVEAVSCC